MAFTERESVEVSGVAFGGREMGVPCHMCAQNKLGEVLKQESHCVKVTA